MSCLPHLLRQLRHPPAGWLWLALLSGLAALVCCALALYGG